MAKPKAKAPPKRCRPTPTDPGLYAEVKEAAKRKFASYPSIYANAWLVRTYKGRGGEYVGCPRSKGGLPKWFAEEWVDLSRPLGPGAWEPCGRPAAATMTRAEYVRTFPRCVPLQRARGMTEAQREAAVRTKRAAMRRSKGARTVVPVGDR